MNIKLLIIIASIVLTSVMLVALDAPDAFAKCIDMDNCPRPLGTSPLKEQIKQYNLVNDIKCMKIEHWLKERPNGKLACVKHGTAEKLGWNNHYYSRADSKGNTIVTSDAAHTIPYEIMGATLEDLSYGDNIFTAIIKPHAQYNVLSLAIPDSMLTLNPQQCSTIQNNTPSQSYVISVNGEDTKVSMSINYSGEKTLDIHTTENAKTIQVIGVCDGSGWW